MPRFVPPETAHLEGSRAAHVIVIAIDGVRPQEIFDGADPSRTDEPRSARALTPNLHTLAERGLALGRPGVGAPMRASGPNFVSLPGYTEMLTGRPAPCQENDCERRPEATMADVFLDAPEKGPVAIVSSWWRLEAVAQAERGRAFVSAGRTHREGDAPWLSDQALRRALERGEEAAPSPGWGDYRPDERTIDVALETMRAARPRFLFVSLGDTDEHAHAGNYDGYATALAQADRFVGEVDRIARDWDARGEPTAIFVTTDHGRSASFREHGREFPESADVWVVAAGAGIPKRGEVALAQERTLSDLPTTIAAVAGIALPETLSGHDLTMAREPSQTLAFHGDPAEVDEN